MTTLRQYGAGLKLVGRILLLELFGKRLRADGATPTDGQVLKYTASVDALEFGTVSGGGSLPAGTNGGVMAYAAGAWASTAVGTAGQVLASNGTAAAAYTQTVLPLTQRAVDAASAAVTTCATLVHTLSAGVGAPGIGARCAFNVLNGAGDITPVASIDAVAIDTTGGAEIGVLDVVVTSVGAVDARCARFWPSGVALGGVTSDLPSDAALGLKWTTRSIVVRNSLDSAWLDVWRADGSGFWTFGSTSSSSGGVVLLAPSTGEIYLRRGSDTYLGVDASGDLALGFATKPTTLRGSAITITTAPVVAIDDATTAGVTTALTLRHTTTGTAAAGIGTRLLLQSEDAGGTTEDVAAIDAVLTNAGAATEASALDVLTRTAGGALRRVGRFTPLGGLILGTSLTADPGAGFLAVPQAGGVYLEQAGTYYQGIGFFGTSEFQIGWTAHTTRIRAYDLIIAAAQGTVMSSGWLDLACGFRRRKTAVSNTNHTVTTTQNIVDLTGLTAARTVTGPAAADGTVVTIANSDGSADGTKTITFAPASGTINGSATHVGVSTAYGSCTYWCNGTNWTVIAKVT